jgi:sodium-dependent dicarboxylate transporter 2/3/5
VALGLDPRLVMIPATIATSCGFMLPAGTPPNAIAFGTGRVPISQMLKYGFWLNVSGVFLCTAATWLLLIPQQGIRLDELPEWARPKAVSSPVEIDKDEKPLPQPAGSTR